MRSLTLLIVTLLLATVIAAKEPSSGFAGRPLADALHVLQQRGLRIVFSSSVVTDAMVVRAEPRASEPRRVLDELLRPHGLEATRGPGGILQIVRRRRPEVSPPDAAGSAKARQKTPRPTTDWHQPAYQEAVLVNARQSDSEKHDAATDVALSRAEMESRVGLLGRDPLMAAHTLPRVAASDDFRSEFSVRGSTPRQLAVVIDGVATPSLQHVVYGVGDSASLAMINPDVIERAALQVGAYPRRAGDSLGGQLTLTVREGSRTRAAFSGSVGGVAASVVAEGPLGRSARGSWLLSGRQSYLDWPTTRFGAEYGGLAFAFRDVQAKTVYDASESQQGSVTVLAGTSVSDNGDEVGAAGVFRGEHGAAAVSFGWRSAIGSSTVLRQRAALVAEDGRTFSVEGDLLTSGSERDVLYAVDMVRVFSRGVIEAGVEAQHRRGDYRLTPSSQHSTGAAFERSGYFHTTWRIAPGLTISPGVKAAHSSVASRSMVTPWILGEWSWRAGWTLSASGGEGHQFASLRQAAGPDAVVRLAPERARYFDLSLSRQITSSVRVQGTIFDRLERDVLRARDTRPRVVDGVLVEPLAITPYRNGLRGRSRGAEIVLERAGDTGLAGTIAYSFGRTHHTDAATGERFWADFDQRHAVNLFASYRFSRSSVSAAFRTGSNFPIVGYFTVRDGALVAGDRPNVVRRPPYARLDLQGSRTFAIGERSLTLVVELLNALNRTNLGPAPGVIRDNGEAVGFTERLLPRFVTAGLRIAF
jgi:hypothetical protein